MRESIVWVVSPCSSATSSTSSEGGSQSCTDISPSFEGCLASSAGSMDGMGNFMAILIDSIAFIDSVVVTLELGLAVLAISFVALELG